MDWFFWVVVLVLALASWGGANGIIGLVGCLVGVFVFCSVCKWIWEAISKKKKEDS